MGVPPLMETLIICTSWTLRHGSFPFAFDLLHDAPCQAPGSRADVLKNGERFRRTYGGWLRNPAPVDRWFILLCIGFQPSFRWCKISQPSTVCSTKSTRPIRPPSGPIWEYLKSEKDSVPHELALSEGASENRRFWNFRSSMISMRKNSRAPKLGAFYFT